MGRASVPARSARVGRRRMAPDEPPQLYLQRDQPAGVPPLALTGERTLPGRARGELLVPPAPRRLRVDRARASAGLRVVDMACGEGYGADVLARARGAPWSASTRTRRPTSTRACATRRARTCASPATSSRRSRGAVRRGRVPADDRARARTPTRCSSTSRRMLAARSRRPRLDAERPHARARGRGAVGNPWHVKEYRAEEFRALCARALRRRRAARPLPRAQAARCTSSRCAHARWDDVHARLGITSAFYDRFTPAISERDFALRSERDGADLDGALDLLAVCRPEPPPRARRARPRPAHAHALRRGLRHVAVRRGVAVGGGRRRSYLPLLDVLDARRAVRCRSRRCWPTSSRRPGRRSGCAPSSWTCGRARTRSTSRRAPAALRAGARAQRRGDYARAARAPGRARRRPARRRSRRTRRWTSAATHAVLPLLRDRRRRPAAARGPGSPRTARAAATPGGGGFWLPECAHAPWLDPLLEQAGVHATCVDLTDVLGPATPGTCGRGARRPGRCSCRSTAPSIELVWSDARLPRARRPTATTTPSRRTTTAPWANDGAPYDPDRARRRRSRADAADFVARVARAGAPAAALLRLRARHRAARALVVRGPGVARRGPGRGRARRAWRARRSTTRVADVTRAGPAARRRARDDVGDAADALDVGGPAGRRPRARRARGGAARRGRRRRRGRPRACASCSRCSPATGPSWARRDGRPVPARARRRAPRGARPGAGGRGGGRPRAVARAAPGPCRRAGALRTFRPPRLAKVCAAADHPHRRAPAALRRGTGDPGGRHVRPRGESPAQPV